MLLRIADLTIRLPTAVRRVTGSSVVIAIHPATGRLSIWREEAWTREVAERSIVPPGVDLRPALLRRWMEARASDFEIGRDHRLVIPEFLARAGRLEEAEEVSAIVVDDRVDLLPWPELDPAPDTAPAPRLVLTREDLGVYVTDGGPTLDRMVAMRSMTVDPGLVHRAAAAILRIPVTDQGGPTPARVDVIRTLVEAGAIPESLGPTVETINTVPDGLWTDIGPLANALKPDDDVVTAWRLELVDAPSELAGRIDIPILDPLRHCSDEPPLGVLLDALEVARDAGWVASLAFSTIEPRDEDVGTTTGGDITSIDVELAPAEASAPVPGNALLRATSRSGRADGVGFLQLAVRNRRTITFELPNGDWTSDRELAIRHARTRSARRYDGLLPCPVRRRAAIKTELRLLDLHHRDHALGPLRMRDGVGWEPDPAGVEDAVLALTAHLLEHGFTVEERWQHGGEEPLGFHGVAHPTELDCFYVRRPRGTR